MGTLDYLQNIFLYNEKEPLLFTRFYFWAFYAVVLTFYSFLYNKRISRSTYLFLISLFFYYKSSGFFFFILIFSTLTDFYIGQFIYRSKNPTHRKLLVALSVFVNLGLLCYFKYAYFFTDTFNHIFNADRQVINWLAVWMNDATGTHFKVSQILLPVGISFFTFQTISYSVDIYRNKVKPVNSLLDFGFYVSFFPQLVAGPIVRASEFIPQLYKKFELSKWEFGYAIFIILKGLIKKILIGDYIAVNFVDRVFGDPLSYGGFENLMALIGYSLQVYCDFSGYTDIAIGVALLMGFRLPANFNSPYKANSVGDFWRRWHISLSTWLKDYLYIPLGGNRMGKSRTNINLMLTMLLGGLWHGASWQFVIWGGLNGVGLIMYKYWKRISPYQHLKTWPVHLWKVFITFSFITFTRIWFRSETMEIANNMLLQIGTAWDFSLIPEMILSYKYVFLIMILGFVVHWLPVSLKEKYTDWFIFTPVYIKIILAVITVFIVYQSITSDLQPFIYFQF